MFSPLASAHYSCLSIFFFLSILRNSIFWFETVVTVSTHTVLWSLACVWLFMFRFGLYLSYDMWFYFQFRKLFTFLWALVSDFWLMFSVHSLTSLWILWCRHVKTVSYLRCSTIQHKHTVGWIQRHVYPSEMRREK